MHSQFAHNPTAARAPDGTYLLYHVGCGVPEKERCTDCAGGVTGASCLAAAAADAADALLGGGGAAPPPRVAPGSGAGGAAAAAADDDDPGCNENTTSVLYAASDTRAVF